MHLDMVGITRVCVFNVETSTAAGESVNHVDGIAVDESSVLLAVIFHECVGTEDVLTGDNGYLYSCVVGLRGYGCPGSPCKNQLVS